MNRLIEFRVWAKAWKPPQFVPLKDFILYNPENLDDVFREFNDPTSLFVFQQFTGLTDKNGKKIFEGDIVTWIVIKGNICSNRIGEITISNGHTYANGGFLDMINFKCKIVGNIFENPELLK